MYSLARVTALPGGVKAWMCRVGCILGPLGDSWEKKKQYLMDNSALRSPPRYLLFAATAFIGIPFIEMICDVIPGV